MSLGDKNYTDTVVKKKGIQLKTLKQNPWKIDFTYGLVVLLPKFGKKYLSPHNKVAGQASARINASIALISTWPTLQQGITKLSCCLDRCNNCVNRNVTQLMKIVLLVFGIRVTFFYDVVHIRLLGLLPLMD